jgi:hypothetical protein
MRRPIRVMSKSWERNRQFIKDKREKYPLLVVTEHGPSLRPETVEAFLGHTSMARVPMGETRIVWMFRDRGDVEKFMAEYGGAVEEGG